MKHDPPQAACCDSTSLNAPGLVESCDQARDCNDSQATEPARASTASIVPNSASPETSVARQRRQARPWQATDLTGRLDPAATPPDHLPDTNSRPAEIRIPRRWDRLARLVSEAGVRQLMSARVVVFGLGGVGSYAVEALTRSAVGSLMLVDFDDVCVTNVNRQLQAFPGTVGQSKTELLAARVRAINPDASVEAVQAFYDPETSPALLSPRPDFVIDAIDNVTAKLHLVTTCLKLGIPVVSVTGSGARLDPTQVRVADVSQTRHDPLARVMRKELSRRGFNTAHHVGLPVVFSEEELIAPIEPSWDAEGFRCICPHAEDSPHGCENRRMIYGTASFVTAAFGMAATSVAVKHLIGR